MAKNSGYKREIGWSWEWLPARCKFGAVPHDWTTNSFRVTSYQPNTTVERKWITCRECHKVKPSPPF